MINWWNFLLFLLNIGANVDRLELVGQSKLLQGDRGLNSIRRGPRVKGDVGRHGGVGSADGRG